MESSLKPVDFREHVNLNVSGLRLCGLWFYIPYPKTTIWFWLHILVRFIHGVFVFTIPPLLQLIYVLKLLASDNFEIEHIAASINLVMTELFVTLRLFNMFCTRDMITELIDQLVTGEFQRTTHRNVLESAIRKSKNLFWFFMCCTIIDVFFHMVIVPGMKGYQSLPVNMDFIFFDGNEPPYLYYAIFFQIVYKLPLIVLLIVVITLPWSILLCAIAQLDILNDNFENMKTFVKTSMVEKKCTKDEAYKYVVHRFLVHHQAIIKFTDTAKATFGGQFALTLLLSSAVICTTGVQFFSIKSPSQNLIAVFWIILYVLIFVVILFTDCYFGNSVYIKSTDLATVIYGSPWLEMPRDLKKNLVLMMARAQKPLAMTAFNIFDVSLPTFTMVMNWTYTAFAVMNGMK